MPCPSIRLLIVAAMLAAPLGACGGESDSGCSSRDSLTVLAASSLAVVADEMRARFVDIEPCVDITFSFGSSGALAAQIASGVPADVFLSAGKKATDQVVDSRTVVKGPTDFVRNSLAIMVNTKSEFAGKITGLLDLTDARNSGVLVGLCDQNAPCGQLADKVLSNAVTAGIDVSRASVADTETNSVEGLVNKVELGEIDAGLVYASDCVAATQRTVVKCVAIRESVDGKRVNDFTTYSAMTLNAKPQTLRFFDLVTGAEFVSALTQRFGFSE